MHAILNYFSIFKLAMLIKKITSYTIFVHNYVYVGKALTAWSYMYRNVLLMHTT